MQQRSIAPSGQSFEAKPERPPNYLVRAIILLLLLSPLCLLIGACGSKGALVLPPKQGSEQQPSNSSNK